MLPELDPAIKKDGSDGDKNAGVHLKKKVEAPALEADLKPKPSGQGLRSFS